MSGDGGYALSYRRLWSHPVFRNKQEAAVFAWMKDIAQWQATEIRTRFGPIALQRGELVIAERELAEDFGLHRNTLRALLQRMADDGMITLIRDRIPHRAGTVVAVTNYDKHQSLAAASAEAEDRKRTVSGTEPGPKEDRSGTKNKEDNTSKDSSRSVARDRAELKGQILRDLGLFEHASWRGDASRIDMWLNAGFDPWLDIVPCIQGRLPMMHDPPPLKYWDKPIAEYHAARLALPIAGTSNGSSRRTVPPRGDYEANLRRNLQGVVDALADELGPSGIVAEPC